MPETTIQARVLKNFHPQGLRGTNGTRRVILRVYALQRFASSANTEVVPRGTPGSGDFYLEAECEVTGTDLAIPEITLQSTIDAFVPQERAATYYAGFYSRAGGLIEVYDGFTNFRLSPDSPQSWSDIYAYNNPPVYVRPPFATLTAEQIIALISELSDRIDALEEGRPVPPPFVSDVTYGIAEYLLAPYGGLGEEVVTPPSEETGLWGSGLYGQLLWGA